MVVRRDSHLSQVPEAFRSRPHKTADRIDCMQRQPRRDIVQDVTTLGERPVTLGANSSPLPPSLLSPLTVVLAGRGRTCGSSGGLDRPKYFSQQRGRA
jgi:hypothetical protein